MNFVENRIPQNLWKLESKFPVEFGFPEVNEFTQNLFFGQKLDF